MGRVGAKAPYKEKYFFAALKRCATQRLHAVGESHHSTGIIIRKGCKIRKRCEGSFDCAMTSLRELIAALRMTILGWRGSGQALSQRTGKMGHPATKKVEAVGESHFSQRTREMGHPVFVMLFRISAGAEFDARSGCGRACAQGGHHLHPRERLYRCSVERAIQFDPARRGHRGEGRSYSGVGKEC